MDASDLTNMDTQEIASALSNLSMEHLIEAVIMLVVGLVLIHYLLVLIRRAVDRIPADRALAGYVQSALRIVLFLILGTMIADRLGLPVSTLVAMLSLFALAISLSLQNTLSNVASGFMILSARLFAAGDWVEVGSSSGTVESINLMYTILTTADQRRVLIPNSDMASSRVINYSAYHLRRIDLSVRAGYEYQNRQVFESLLRAAQSIDLVEKEAPHQPVSVVLSYDEGGVTYQLRVWTVQNQYLAVKEALLDRMRTQLAADGIILREAVTPVRMEKNPAIREPGESGH